MKNAHLLFMAYIVHCPPVVFVGRAVYRDFKNHLQLHRGLSVVEEVHRTTVQKYILPK